jgi:Rps23 Pro-64 3,4-dihydroxylase Tpa1-like proline 4-hydroxylase
MQNTNSKITKTRRDYAEQISHKLEQSKYSLQRSFGINNRIQTCYIDDLLDDNDAREIYDFFPDKENLLQMKDLREYKYVGMQMNKFNPILEEIIYAFQSPKVVNIISEITGFEELLPDESLYAGGISLMEYGCFLNPHLDNSHDKNRNNYRVMNLLYYVTPNWKEDYGGNLELWDNGLKQPCRTIHYKFNRLVIMVTNKTSWHSVSKINYQGRRCCVSNYYFSSKPAEAEKYFHVTSFRGRPEQGLRDIVLQGDAILRNGIRKIVKYGIKKPSIYRK